MHYQKYLESKSRYLSIKKQIGGTKEENNNFILHGTNLFYIDDIKVNGITGKYNQIIYDIIKKYWNKIKYLSTGEYVGDFIERQDIVRSSGKISLSFTGQASVAEEYTKGNRRFGEGPTRFLRTLERYISENKECVTEDMIKDAKFLKNAYRHPGIILAIDKNDFVDTMELPISALNEWEYSFNFQIPAINLYIRRNKNDYIKLLSGEGIQYINKLKSDHLDDTQKHCVDAERIKSLEGWKTEIRGGPIYYSYQIEKMNGPYSIVAVYDIKNETRFPHYLQIQINNYLDIDINIAIINILETCDYETKYVMLKGREIFMSNDELKEKFKTVIDGIITFIPSDRKDKIYNIVIGIFPYLKPYDMCN